MADHGTLNLFDDDVAPPAPAVRRPHAPVRDEPMALALTYEQAVLDCLETFKDRKNYRAQVEACLRFEEAMKAYMALPKATYKRTERALDARGKIDGSEWQRIMDRMANLASLPDERLRGPNA